MGKCLSKQKGWNHCKSWTRFQQQQLWTVNPVLKSYVGVNPILAHQDRKSAFVTNMGRHVRCDGSAYKNNMAS